MKKALLILVLLFSATGHGQEQTPGGDATKGKATFLRVGCYACHGTVGQGGTGPHLGPNPRTLEGLVAFVRKPTGMPAYSPKVLSDADIADIRAYLSSVPAPVPVVRIPLLNQ